MTNKYPYHQALPKTKRGFMSWTGGYYKSNYYIGFKLGLENGAINNEQFTTAARRGWEAGYKQRQVIQLLTRGET